MTDNSPIPPQQSMTKTGSLLPVRPDVLLRTEGASILLAVILAYGYWFPGHWLFFAVLLLFPDVSLLAYLGGSRWYSVVAYNVLHSYILPVLLGLLAFHAHHAVAGRITLIWIAHIAMDRAVGYGLKYPGVFKFTHIQRAATLD